MKVDNEIRTGIISVDAVKISDNFRKNYDKTKLQELANNIKKVGVLEPILIRKETGALISGARRLKAAKMAGLADIPFREINVTEQEALEIQVFENLHRDNLSAIDEARAFKILVAGKKYDVAALAAQVDKSVDYVYRALKLLELPDIAIKALERGILPTRYAHEILRAGPKYRERLTKFATRINEWSKSIPSFSELHREVESRHEKILSSAKFPKDNEYAGMKACSKCEFNTINQEMLFSGIDKENGKCVNSECFLKKKKQFEKDFQILKQKNFGDLPFMGFVNENYYNSGLPEIKGNKILTVNEASAPKIQEAIKKTPDKFGWAIVRPNEYGIAKVMKAYYVCKDKALFPAESAGPARSKDDILKEEIFTEVYQTNIANEIVRKTKGKSVGTKEIIKIIEDNRLNDRVFNVLFNLPKNDAPDYEKKYLKNFGRAPLSKLKQALYILVFNDWDTEDMAHSLGIEIKKIKAESRKEAKKMFLKSRGEKKKK